MATKKSPTTRKTRSSRTGGQKQSARAKPSPKKKTVSKRTPSASPKEAPRRGEGARSILKEFRVKKRVKSLFALGTREDLQGKTVAELRAIAREAGLRLTARSKTEIIKEIAGGLGLFPAVRKKPSIKVKKPSPQRRKKPAPAKKRVVRPARPILKEKPAVIVKEMEVEAALPQAPEVMAPHEEPLVEKALGTVLKEEIKEEISEISFPTEHALGKPAQAEEAEKPRDVDRIVAVAVDPHTMFVDWDVTESTAKRGKPVMRVYDVTGVEFNGENYREFEDIQLSGRSGESFIEVIPDREYIVDTGVMDAAGRFRPARRTSKVTTPPEEPAEGTSVLPEEYFEFRPIDYGHR